MGFQPKKKIGFQNWKLGFYSDSFWDSKIYVGFQKICRILQTLRIQTGIFGSISAKIVVNSRGLLHDTF